MSRKNKVNPDHYKLAGRLSADDLARERMRQITPKTGKAPAKNRGTPQRRKTAAATKKKQ
jgi:hypothetical protein